MNEVTINGNRKNCFVQILMKFGRTKQGMQNSFRPTC